MTFSFDINNYNDLVNNSELGSSGYYPIGTGNFWHSGVHINYKSGDRIIKPLIPNGKVVLFRLNKEYEECKLPEKLTEDSYNHEFANYKDKYTEVIEDDYKYYKLNDGDDNTYSISNNFVLLKHKIEDEHLYKPLEFYSLYMNLAPVTDKIQDSRVLHTKNKPFYPDCMLNETTKELKSGCVQIKYENSQFLTQIGKPGILKGEWYFDFCVFFEKSLFDFKEKILGKKIILFHHFDKSVKILKKTDKRKCESRKFYWPTGTKADITSYTDAGETFYEYKINKIRPVFETSVAKANVDYKIEGDKIKILKTDNLFLSSKKIAETEFTLKNIINAKFDKTYVQGKPAFFISSDYFDIAGFWTKNGNLNKQNETDGIVVYDKNPLIYKYEEENLSEEFYSHITGVESKQIQTDNLDKEVVKLITDNGTEVFIKASDKEKCMRSVFDWSSWFYQLNDLEFSKSDIVCDRTLATEFAIKFHNKAVENKELYEDMIEKWWYGSYLVDEYLKGIFGNSNKYEFAKSMRTEFRKAMCQHPLEWDKRLFNCDKIESDYRDVTNKNLHASIKNKLIKESEKTDIWENAFSKIFKENKFFFVNPIYFLNHLDKAGVFEFNPYEKEENKAKLFVPADWKIANGIEYGSPGGTEVLNKDSALNNPGCAPFTEKAGSEDYAKLTGIFNEDYLKVARYWNNGTPDLYLNYRSKYHHFGVDFSAKKGTKIKSFIYGKIVAKGWISTNGRCLLIQRNSNNYLYLLCHLNGYPSEITVGKEISPGDIIAYTGTSGATTTKCSETTFSNDPHLHLSVLEYNKSFILKDCLEVSNKSGTTENRYNWKNSFQKNYIDPFNYETKWISTVSIPGKE